MRCLTTSQVKYLIVKKIKSIFSYNNYTRVKKMPNHCETFNCALDDLDFNKDYLKRFNADEILGNIFTFINRKIKIDITKTWNDTEISKHWRDNLHYFDYTYILAEAYLKKEDDKYYDKYKELIESWIDNNPINKKDVWHPLTASIRLINWIAGYKLFYNAIKKDAEFEQKLIKSIYIHYRYIYDNMEDCFSGYNYFENIRALIAGSLFFEQHEKVKKFAGELNTIMKTQILKDGFHFELSPMYHNIVLEGLIKIKYWFDNADIKIKEEVLPYIKKMLDCSYSIETDMGRLPLFNNCAINISKNLDSLIHTVEKYWNLKAGPKISFKYSGYFILEQGNKKAVISCGKLGAHYLSHRAHCDALSYELAVDGKPFIVNSGTYQYDEEKWKNCFRSTEAHNTVSINNTQQFQCAGSFKAAKRISRPEGALIDMPNGSLTFRGSYFNCKNDFHMRCILWATEDILLVLDKVIVKKNTEINNYIHAHPDYQIRRSKHWDVIKNSVKFAEIQPIFSEYQDLLFGEETNGWYAPEFGIKVRNNVLEIRGKTEKPYSGYIIDFGNNNITIKKDSEIILMEYGGKIKVIDLKYIGL